MISFQEFRSKCTSQRWSNSREISFRVDDGLEWVEVLEGKDADDPKAKLAAQRKMYKNYLQGSEPEPPFNSEVAERFNRKDMTPSGPVDLAEPLTELPEGE